MKLLAVAAMAGCAVAQTPDVDDIMSRVAINQAKALEMRTQFVYTQKQLLRMVRSNGKLAREERREYVVTPKIRGVKKELTRFEGKYEEHGSHISFDRPGYEHGKMDLDGDLLEAMSKDMTNACRSQDGIARDLFPLTYHQQLKYDFRLLGTESYRGRQVYRVSFEPKPHLHLEGSEAIWKGEALLDAAEYQPVLVTTKMALNIPLAVKVLLGTDIKGLGFSVSYQKFEDGLWFPVSYGGEFHVRGLFLYRRNISISVANSDFRRTDVVSNVTYAASGQ